MVKLKAGRAHDGCNLHERAVQFNLSPPVSQALVPMTDRDQLWFQCSQLPSTMTDVTTAKLARYTTFLRNKLEPDLQSVRESLATIELDLQQYEQLADQLGTMVTKSKNGENRMETMLELGFGVYAEAVIPDFSEITLDLGLNVHLDMSLDEALSYVKRRREVLEKKLGVVRSREAVVLEQIAAVHGALAEIAT